MGYFYILLYAVLSAYQGVVLSGVFSKDSIFVFIAVNFMLVMVLFLVLYGIRIVSNKKTVDELRALRFSNVLIINVITASNWICYYVALKFIEPSIQSAIACATPPLFISICDFLCKKIRLARYKVISMLGLLVGTIFLVVVSLVGQSGIGISSTLNIVIGIIMAILGGVSVSLYTMYSKKISDQGLSPSLIMCFRFPLVIIIALLYVPKDGLQRLLTDDSLYFYLFTSVIGTAIPIFLLQKAMAMLKPIQVALSLAWLPLCFFIQQILISNIKFSWLSLCGLLIIIVSLLIIPIVSRAQNRSLNRF